MKNIYVLGGYSRLPGGRWSDSQSLNSVECYNSFTQVKILPDNFPNSEFWQALIQDVSLGSTDPIGSTYSDEKDCGWG